MGLPGVLSIEEVSEQPLRLLQQSQSTGTPATHSAQARPRELGHHVQESHKPVLTKGQVPDWGVI